MIPELHDSPAPSQSSPESMQPLTQRVIDPLPQFREFPISVVHSGSLSPDEERLAWLIASKVES